MIRWCVPPAVDRLIQLHSLGWMVFDQRLLHSRQHLREFCLRYRSERRRHSVRPSPCIVQRVEYRSRVLVVAKQSASQCAYYARQSNQNSSLASYLDAACLFCGTSISGGVSGLGRDRQAFQRKQRSTKRQQSRSANSHDPLPSESSQRVGA